MGQSLRQDNIPPMLKATSTTCTIAATHMGDTTRITIGGQQYALSSTLTLSTATTGLGGLDTGTLSNNFDLYYVYACVNTGGAVGLVGSLTGPTTGPSGFSGRNKLIGAFYSNNSGNQIGATVNTTGVADTEWTSYVGTITNTGAKVFTFVGFWKRQGDRVLFKIGASGNSTASGSALSTVVTVDWPFPADVNKLPGGIGADASNVGSWWSNGFYTGASALNPKGGMSLSTTTSAAMYRNWDGTGFATTIMRISDLNVARVVNIYVDGSVPVIGWGKTLLG